MHNCNDFCCNKLLFDLIWRINPLEQTSNSDKFAYSTCVGSEQYVDCSPKESLLILVYAFVKSRVNHCNDLLFRSYSYLLDGIQSVLNSTARLVLNISKFSNISAAIVMSSIGFISGEGMTSRSPLWSDTAWLVLLRSIWRSWAIQLGQLSVDNVSSRLLMVISLFRGFGFRHLAIGLRWPSIWNSLLLNIRQMCCQIYYFSKWNWKHISPSSSEHFCGYISNEGPCKFSTLQLTASCTLITHLQGFGSVHACFHHQQQTGLLQQSSCWGKWPADRSAV